MKDNFSAESYDAIYSKSRKYSQHYSKLRFYPVWYRCFELLKGSRSFIELGCGCGHLAQMFSERGNYKYLGYDFSPVAIEKAKKRVPNYNFQVADLMKIRYKEKTYVATEVFEHLENDKALIKLLPKGSRIVFSVPNYKADNHYRTYQGAAHIRVYYDNLLDIKSIKSFNQNLAGDTIFVVDAIVL